MDRPVGRQCLLDDTGAQPGVGDVDVVVRPGVRGGEAAAGSGAAARRVPAAGPGRAGAGARGPNLVPFDVTVCEPTA